MSNSLVLVLLFPSFGIAVSGDGVCSKSGSFLGVGNSECIRDNIALTIVFVTFFIIISVGLEYAVKRIRASVKCPQMRIIVNRIFEEIMILGFLSTVLFALDSSGATSNLSATLDDAQERHFQEFFHYVVFLSMIYYIFIMLILLAIGKFVPRWLWHSLPVDDDPPQLPRVISGAIQTSSIAYNRLRERMQMEPWTFTCNVRRQWQLWKNLEVLAYHLCRDRSRAVYSNQMEMQRIFGLTDKQSRHVDYQAYNKLCMRNMLANIAPLHWSAFFVLIGVVIGTSWFPAFDEYVFISVGAFLMLLSIVIMIKTSHILQGIVKDRLTVLTQKEIDNVAIMRKSDLVTREHLSFKALAIGVRAIIRMQMSALSHQALHYHDERFWFRSPWFLLRLFQ